MKRYFLLVLTSLTFFVCTTKAQQADTTAIGFEEEYIDTSKKFNELGINVAQWMIYLMGGEATPRFELKYKRQLNQKALRFGGFISPDDKFTFVSYRSDSANTKDTTNILEKKLNQYYGFSVGLEWHSILNTFDLFYGTDLIYSYKLTGTNINTFTYDSASVKTVSYYKETRSTETEITSYGAEPFVGVKYQISPGISFSIQTGFRVAIQTGTVIFTDTDNTVTKDKISQFGLDFGPIFNNISLSIHF